MNVSMKIWYATLDFVLLNIAVGINSTIDLYSALWYSLCIVLAFVLRLGMEARKDRLTWKSLLYQSIYTLSWSFFMILVWNTWLNYKSGFEVYLFINSLFSVFMVGQFEIMFEIGFKEWMRVKLGKFLATERAVQPTEKTEENL